MDPPSCQVLPGMPQKALRMPWQAVGLPIRASQAPVIRRPDAGTPES